jgi:hypothetical protein
MAQYRLNVFGFHGFDRLSFPSLTPPPLKASHGAQCFHDRGGAKFLGDEPLEHPSDASTVLIDEASTEAGGDHGLTN